MPIFVCQCHLLQNLLDILLGGFHYAIHLWLIRRGIIMLNLELYAEFRDHSIVEIGTIICDDSLWNTIPTYEVMFDKAGNHIFGDRGEGSCFDPFSKVVNGNQDEAMSVGSRGLDLSNHINAPHCKWPRSSQNVERNRRDMNFVSVDLTFVASTGMLMAVSFHGRPVIACP